MASEEAIEYCKSIGYKDGRCYACGNLEDVECSDMIATAFDAGAESERKKHEWHNPEELPIQQENEVKKLFLIKFTMNHSDEVHVGCSYFSFSLNKFSFPVDFKFQDTCKLISWKEIN